jgi:hypothetical protein
VSDVAKVSEALNLALFGMNRSLPDLKRSTVDEIKKSRDFRELKGKAKTKTFIAQFERAVDEDFFEHLFEEVGESIGSEAAKACRKRWIELIWQRAGDALAAAEAGSPLSGVRRYRARAAAKGLLDGAIANAFSDLLKRTPAS